MKLQALSLSLFSCVPALAACGDDGGAAVELTITEPEGTTEIVPGGTIDLAWEVTGPAEVVLTMTPLNEPAGVVIYDEPVEAGATTFVWDGHDLQGNLLPPDVYDLSVTAFVDGDPVDESVRSIAVHGVTITDPAPGETRVILGSEGIVDLHYRTVSQRVIALETRLLPGELLVDTRTIPGEFVPFTRDVAFNGMTVAGDAVPAGTYTVVVDASDADTELAYRVEGGMVDWQPGN
jgi:hypothetical protein